MIKCSAEGCEEQARVKGLCFKHYMRLRRTGVLTTTRLTGSFWSKVERGTPEVCWPWKGFKKPSGHGLTSIKGFPMHTSRKAWILAKGPIEPGLQVLHKCDNAICCNPDHLYLGDRIDNMIDLWSNPPAAERRARNQKHVLDDAGLALLWEMRKGGATLKECAAAVGVHIGTVCRYITTARKQKLAEIRAARLVSNKPDRV